MLYDPCPIPKKVGFLSRIRNSHCLIYLILLVGCNAPTNIPTSDTNNPKASVNTSAPKNITPAPSPTTVSENFKITADRIGDAKLGMSLGELKNKLGTNAQFQVKSPFMADFDAIAVIQAGETQYYILYPAGNPLKDTGTITTLLTDNPRYRTDKGVGPGTPIKQAIAVYGEATLSYNLAMEGREYVRFANQPAKNIFFRLGSYGNNSLAGIYPSSSGEYKQTKQYKDTATIAAVRIDCQLELCSKP